MENRDRNRSEGTTPPDKAGSEQRSGTGAEFGKNLGRSEQFNEGGDMDNDRGRNKDEDLSNKNLGNESTRRSGNESYGSSSGRSGSPDTNIGNSSGSSKDRGSVERVRDSSVEGEH